MFRHGKRIVRVIKAAPRSTRNSLPANRRTMSRDYTFTNLTILRTPIYSFRDYRGMPGLQELLDEPYFRSAIAVASDGLFRELTQAEFQLKRLSAKARHALHRYYNRMCFRPTPFGLFAGITALEWGASAQIILGNNKIIHSFPDFKSVVALSDQVTRESTSDVILYALNNTLYSLKTEYRYLSYTDNASLKRIFYLYQMERSKEMDKFFCFLQTGKNRAAIIEYLVLSAGFSELDAQLFFLQLAEEQVIQPVLSPATNGADLVPSDAKSGPIQGETGNNRYVNLEVSLQAGMLEKAHQQVILDALNVIDRLVPQQEPPELYTFLKAFERKYDGQMVPLLEALDLEKGIGYGGLMDVVGSDDYRKDVHLEEKKDMAQSVEWTLAHAFLLEHWQMIPANGDVIQLDREKIDRLPMTEALYPSNMSVLFRMADDGIYIEQAGGASASALAGRFTFFHDKIWQHQKEIAEMEQRSNPDVIMAEVSHISHLHTANIDRRRHIYSYEIPILTGSSLDPGKQILLNDLWVCVDHGTIILWSKRLNKRIVPRLSSAFNYKNDKLPVFRFLCDLQQHQVKTGFHFDLEDFFPGLKHYPRIQVGKVILQLARWNLDEFELKRLSALAENEKIIRLLKEWQIKYRWPRYISLDEHDNQLVFDTSNDDSLLFLRDNIKAVKKAVIREFPFCRQSAVAGSDNKPRINQFIAAIRHDAPVYRSNKDYGRLIQMAQNKQRKYITGSEWLYVKLYCHPSKANELLLSCLMPLMQTARARKITTKWFFIRYRDPEYHLRLRFHINPDDTGQMIVLLQDAFFNAVENGTVTGIQYDSYKRELERYVLTEETERVFYDSSRLTLCYLNSLSQTDTGGHEQFIVDCTQSMTAAFGLTGEARAGMFQQLYLSLYAGFINSQATNEQLKQRYRDFQKVIVASKTSHPTIAVEFAAFQKGLSGISGKAAEWNDRDRFTLLGDIIHMHLNRLLTDGQREQELVIYYCLYKHYYSEHARYIHANCALSTALSG